MSDLQNSKDTLLVVKEHSVDVPQNSKLIFNASSTVAGRVGEALAGTVGGALDFANCSSKKLEDYQNSGNKFVPH